MTKARDLANGASALSAVSATELGYLDGVTSAVQTQINNKQAVVSGVNDTEIGYLDGVTSAVQTQLDAKIAKTLTTTTGDIIYASSANTPARLGIGSTDQVLKVSGGVPTWATPATTAPGLTLINTASFSGASIVSLPNDSFTNTYDNYKLIIYVSSTSGTNVYIHGRLRAAGTDNTNSSYTSQFFVMSHTSTSAANDHGGAASSAFARFGYSANTTTPSNTQFDIFNPKVTARTTYSGTITGNAPENWLASGLFAATTSFDSLSFYPTSGTFSGTYSLYGYNK